MPDKELAAHIFRGNRHKFAKQTQNRISLRMNLRLVFSNQLEPAVNQECAEQINNPLELPNESHTEKDEEAAHNQRANNSPEENPVLVGGGIPYFPRRERRVDLELIETRTFSSRVVHLRYRVAR